MLRWITVCLLLSATAVGLVWVASPKIIADAQVSSAEPSKPKENETPPPEAVSQNWPSQGVQLKLLTYPAPKTARMTEPIVIPNAHLVIAEVQEVPSEKDGILLFIGTEIQPGEVVPPEKELPKALQGFLAVPLGEGEKVNEGEKTFKYSEKKYRQVRPGDALKPNKIVLFTDELKVRKLKVGDVVKRGQLLGIVDPKKAFDDVAVRLAKLDGSEADRIGSLEQAKTYWNKHRRIKLGENITRGATSEDEQEATWMQYQKFYNEEKLKAAEVKKAQRELNAGLTDLRMHEIRAGIDGVVKVIYKNSVGESIKVNENVLQIQNPNLLRVDGLLEVQEALKLKEGMKVFVEASRLDSPHLVIGGHLGAVNCVAVSKGKNPVIVSGSDDETLCGWDSANGARLWELEGLHSAVRSAACSPPRAKHNLVLFGCADGSVRILDLANLKNQPLDFSERHQGPVNGAAFSPNGELCATCGDDTHIRLWNTKGELKFLIRSAHRNAVTSVQFASDKKLISAGRDNRLVVWDISGNYPQEISPHFDRRGGEVSQIGVSPDGQSVLFDQGKELQILSLENKHIEGTLQNPSDAVNFSTLALFSPDGKTILTNGPASGKLQLWRTPTKEQRRASELRQFIWTRGTASCGAFAPEAPLVVTGTQDRQVLVWNMPEQKEIDSRLEATLTLVEPSLDTESRKVKVWAELKNPGWLIPGGRATMVVPPQK